MPDPAARDEVAALRAANARLRAVVEAKDTEIAALRAALEAAHARQEELIRRQAELTRSLELRGRRAGAPAGDGQPQFFDPAIEGAAGGEGTPEGGTAGIAARAVQGPQARRPARP